MNPARLLVIFVFLSSVCSAEPRTWTAVNGKKLDAEYVTQKDGIVTLRLESGKTFMVPRNKLSKEDNLFIDSLFSIKAPISHKQNQWVPPKNSVSLNSLKRKTYRSLDTLSLESANNPDGEIETIEWNLDFQNTILLNSNSNPYTGNFHFIYSLNNKKVKKNKFAIEGYLKSGKAHGKVKLYVITNGKKLLTMQEYKQGDPVNLIRYWPNQNPMLWRVYKPLNDNIVLEELSTHLYYPNGNIFTKSHFNQETGEYELLLGTDYYGKYKKSRLSKIAYEEQLKYMDIFKKEYRKHRWKSVFYQPAS